MNSGQGPMGSVLGNGRRVLAEEVPAGYKRTEVGVFPQTGVPVLSEEIGQCLIERLTYEPKNIDSDGLLVLRRHLI